MRLDDRGESRLVAITMGTAGAVAASPDGRARVPAARSPSRTPSAPGTASARRCSRPCQARRPRAARHATPRQRAARRDGRLRRHRLRDRLYANRSRAAFACGDRWQRTRPALLPQRRRHEPKPQQREPCDAVQQNQLRPADNLGDDTEAGPEDPERKAPGTHGARRTAQGHSRTSCSSG